MHVTYTADVKYWLLDKKKYSTQVYLINNITYFPFGSVRNSLKFAKILKYEDFSYFGRKIYAVTSVSFNWLHIGFRIYIYTFEL